MSLCMGRERMERDSEYFHSHYPFLPGTDRSLRKPKCVCLCGCLRACVRVCVRAEVDGVRGWRGLDTVDLIKRCHVTSYGLTSYDLLGFGQIDSSINSTQPGGAETKYEKGKEGEKETKQDFF